MPIVNGNYEAPAWENQNPPAINDTELQALSQTIQTGQILHGSGPPTQYTNGRVGQTYVDTSTVPPDIYILKVSAAEANVWQLNGDPNVNLALQYSAATGYEKGDYRLRNGVLYRAVTDITTPEAWNPAHWSRARLADDLFAHEEDTANPHEVTKAQVGLGNVANVLQYSSDNPPKMLGTIALSAAWTGTESPYSQTVTVTGAAVTASSKIDLQPTAEQITALIGDGVEGIVIENNSGTLRAWALGAAPSAAMTVQCTIEETGETT